MRTSLWTSSYLLSFEPSNIWIRNGNVCGSPHAFVCTALLEGPSRADNGIKREIVLSCSKEVSSSRCCLRGPAELPLKNPDRFQKSPHDPHISQSFARVPRFWVNPLPISILKPSLQVYMRYLRIVVILHMSRVLVTPFSSRCHARCLVHQAARQCLKARRQLKGLYG